LPRDQRREGFFFISTGVLRSVAGKFRIHLCFCQFALLLVSMDNIKNENDEPRFSPGVSKETVELAVKLLLKLIKSKPKDQKPQRPDGFISLVLNSRSDSTTMIPSTSQNIPLPHPLFSIDGSQETCLIIGDEKEGLNAEVAENKIKEEGLPISKVFQLSKLKAAYRRSKGDLCLSFDLFMVCKSVFSTVSPSYQAIINHIIPVDLTHERWRGELESACSLTSISIRHFSRVAKVGRVSQTSKEIVENIVAVIDSLVSEIPEKWNNISSMYLKSSGSLCPLYQSFPGKVKKGELSSKKRTKHAGKTPDAKRKKGLSWEGKAGSFNGLGVSDGVPKDDSRAALGLEKKNESVDLQGGVVANRVKATSKKKKSRKQTKSTVRAV
jgi:hypothetical protein